MWRKCRPGRDVFIETWKSLQNNLRPRLVYRSFPGFGVNAEFKFRIRKCQSIVNSIDPTQPSDTRIHNRTCLQIEITRAARIENFQTSALSLVTKELN